MDAVLFDPENSQRRALILALGTYGTEWLAPGETEPLIGKLLDLYRNDPDAGIHGAVEWALRQWGRQEKLKEADAELMRVKDPGGRRWYVNSQGQTFAVIAGPVEFRMGAPADEPDRAAVTTNSPVGWPSPAGTPSPRPRSRSPSSRSSSRPTRSQSRATTSRRASSSVTPRTRTVPGRLDWYTAAHYCNWLSEQEGCPKTSGAMCRPRKVGRLRA